ncbi:hypothetical protein L6R52_02430 [Myxococcota bacterium]|nr:hypothetical protein [Myxococcota bacterium]
MKYFISIFAITTALGLAACGSDDPGCESVSEKFCAAACACTDDAGKCSIGDANAKITFDNEAGCAALYKAGCGSAEAAALDWAACETAIETAMCVTLDDGTKALTSPAACETAD